MERLGVARHRWDLAVLCNLDEQEGTRPADLLAAVNGRSRPRQLSAQVLSVRLRALEHDGYVRHDDLSRIPLVRVYYLLPQGRVMLQTLHAVAPWDRQMPDRRSRAGTAGR
jgi:DNA-binding HxlR family transcriptional regulator